jgi:hypothetical protein
LGGVVSLEGSAETVPDQNWQGRLYQGLEAARPVPIKAIPYYAWDNRTASPMKVWMPVAPPAPPAGGLERQAKVSLSFTSSNCQPHGINDGLEPGSSGDQPPAVCHWWPHRGGEEWVQYSWAEPVSVAGAKVYWFDDTGRGACRLPGAWRLESLDGSVWQPVTPAPAYKVARDSWGEIAFEPRTTTALRLIVQMQPQWAAGVHEWKIVEADED